MITKTISSGKYVFEVKETTRALRMQVDIIVAKLMVDENKDDILVSEMYKNTQEAVSQIIKTFLVSITCDGQKVEGDLLEYLNEIPEVDSAPIVDRAQEFIVKKKMEPIAPTTPETPPNTPPNTQTSSSSTEA